MVEDCSVDWDFHRPFRSFADRKPDSLKVVLIGDAGVGKTSLISYLKDGISVDRRRQVATIGHPVPVGDIRISVDNQDIGLSLWDTCGQERFFSLGRSFMRDAKAVVFVYSVTHHETLNHLFDNFRGHKSWIDTYLEINDTEKPIVCVFGNKSDLLEDRQVSTKNAKERIIKEATIREMDEFMFWETSAKDGRNLEEFSQTLGKVLLKKYPQNTLSRRLDPLNDNTIRLPSQTKGVKEPKRNSFSSCFGRVKPHSKKKNV